MVNFVFVMVAPCEGDMHTSHNERQAIINVSVISQKSARHCLGLYLENNTNLVALLDIIILLLHTVNPEGELEGWFTLGCIRSLGRSGKTDRGSFC